MSDELRARNEVYEVEPCPLPADYTTALCTEAAEPVQIRRLAEMEDG